jgi:CRISPR-associated endonuclease/helicase Cas3
MTFPRLRAKSGPGENPSEFLARHLQDVFHAAGNLVDSTGDDQLLALGLEPDALRPRFRRLVLLAAAVHDLGKANDHFQGMIYRRRNVRANPQGLRHEWATLLVLREVREWLLPAVDGSVEDFAFLEWAVVGHHPAHNHPSPPKCNPDGSGPELSLLIDHDDFRMALNFIQVTWRLGPLPTFLNTTRSLCGGNSVFAELGGWARRSRVIWDKLRATPEGRLVAALKNSLVAADVAGSAIPKAWPDDRDAWCWISRAFAAKPEEGDLQKVVDHRLGNGTARRFQEEVAASTDPITFVKAGCGTGKTLAAYMWAARNHPTRRLYFCYPTTGTATEGFRDYLFNPEERTPRVGAKLFHSRAVVDFDIILNAAHDAPTSETAQRLEALEAWSTPVVSCTVDTVLGLVQNNRRGLFAWPALSQSAFVFDEIHAFDDRLFGALLRFLRDVPGAPVLLMTASLPAAREASLRELVGERGSTWSAIAGPRDLESRPRYRKATSGSDPLYIIRDALAENPASKILWVCNTVRRVMDCAERAAKLGPLVYHSRFKYEDRVNRHAHVIDAFNRDGPVLAICSQVAEMSLDISAGEASKESGGLLVTDLAPVPALIQRLGRLNRRAENDTPTRPFLVVEPSSYLPYTQDELEAARSWLAKLPDDGISQADLTAAWEQVGDHPPAPVESAWLDGGPITAVSDLREMGPGITILMEDDLSRLRARPKDLPRLMLPMPQPPRALDWRAWAREKGIPIAPRGCIAYDPQRGAEWKA